MHMNQDSDIPSSPPVSATFLLKKYIAEFWLPHKGSFVDASNF